MNAKQNGPEKNKLYEKIVQFFLERIQEGAMNPGDRLPSERVLAGEFGVSRTAIREALRSMELMGLIESHVGEGTFVKSPNLSQMIGPFSMAFAQDRQVNSELIEVRLILETEISRLAARRRGDEHLSELYATLHDMERDINHGGTGVEADKAFHTILAQAAGNQSLNAILSMCSEMLSRTLRITQSMKGVPITTLADHTAIYHAIAAQDEKGARRLMRKHLINAQHNLQKLR